MQLARARLELPRLSRDLVERPRLLDKLAAGLENQITLVAAPAGFGKSTLLANWIARASLPCAWLSLDEDNNDLNLFTAYLVAAVQTVFPGALQATRGLISAPVPLDPARLATTLSNELGELPSEFVLILDDYHVIRDNAVHALMNVLMRQIPKQLHLFVATRTDSPLPLSRLRAEGRLCELRARDLRFLLEEAQDFIQQTVGAHISRPMVEQLQERIEGWAVGLRFAAVLLHESPNPQEVITQLDSSRGHSLMNYMLGEVFTQQAPVVQELMLKTSLLDRFTADYCESVLSAENARSSRGIVDELVDYGILVVMLGEKAPWYRYHALFGDYLRGQARRLLDAATLAKLHRQAARWLDEQGLVAAAIEHLLLAGDPTQAVRLVRTHLHAALDQESARPIIGQWLALFPPEILDSQLDLVIARLWLATVQFKITLIAELLPRADKLLSEAQDPDPILRRQIEAEIAYARVALAQWTNDGVRAVQIAVEYYPSIPLTHEFERGNMLTQLAMAAQLSGKNEMALQVLTDALQEERSRSSSFMMRVMVAFASVYLSNADLYNGAQISERLLQVANGQSYISLGWAHYILGVIHYEWNNLEAATQHFAAGAELRYMGNVKSGHESLARLAVTQQTRGLTQAVNDTLQELATFTQELQSGALLYDEAAYRARVALMQGKADVALRWASSISFSAKPHMTFDVESHLTRLRTLLATGEEHHIKRMLSETEALLELARSLNNPRRLIELYALRALALYALNNQAAALDSLQESLRLGEPGGYLRMYLDMGAGMTRLLNLLMAKHKASPYVRRILAAEPATESVRGTVNRVNTDPAIQLIEPLTLRELQVLEHLAKRQSDKEIAQDLVISPLTVKAHTDHIYQKLGVRSRQEAVKAGIAFGILDKIAANSAFA